MLSFFGGRAGRRQSSTSPEGLGRHHRRRDGDPGPRRRRQRQGRQGRRSQLGRRCRRRGLPGPARTSPRWASASLGGTAAGGLHHKGLKLTDDDKAHIAADLGSGKAAVGVLARIDDAPAIQDELTQLGGATSSHDVVDEAAVLAG